MKSFEIYNIKKMATVIQFISNDKKVKSKCNTIQDLNDLNTQHIATQAKKEEQ